MENNYFPFAELPTVERLDSLERRAIYCEQQGYDKKAKSLWDLITAGEQIRLKAGLDIYSK
jgi:hypothetical protein|tara:strand:- start:22970 stop:23152 length:183 start_codon:yes stop_codon:yes gene_type:complete